MVSTIAAVNSEAEHLRKKPRDAVSHDRRAVGDLIEQFDDFARLDRPGVTVAPARQDIRIQYPLHVFRPASLASERVAS